MLSPLNQQVTKGLHHKDKVEDKEHQIIDSSIGPHLSEIKEPLGLELQSEVLNAITAMNLDMNYQSVPQSLAIFAMKRDA